MKHRMPLPARLAFRAAVLSIACGACLPDGEFFGKTIPGRVDTLVVHNGSEPETLDPCLMAGDPEGNIARDVYEGLTRPDPRTGEPLPGVAERWEARDGHKEYVFHLRTNARWSDGKPVTAHDFVKTWTRLLDPATAGRYASFLYPIVNAEEFNSGKLKDASQLGFRAVDDFTFVVRLVNPTPFFPSLTSFYVTLPTRDDIVRKYGPAWTQPANFVGNGPFRLVVWKMHREVVVEKNPHYWGKNEVKLKRVVYLPIEDSGTAVNLYYAGDMDTVRQPGMEIFSHLKSKKDLQINPMFGSYYYILNTKRPPLDNTLVRRALALSVDRRQIAYNLLGQGQVPAVSFTPPLIPGYKPEAKLAFDPGAARELLARAGYPGGKGFPSFAILYNTSEQHKHIAEVIQKGWEQHLGIKVRLENQEWKVYMKTQDERAFDVCRAGWIGDFPDPITFLDLFLFDGGNNHSGWAHPRYAALVRAGMAEGDPVRRFALFREAEAFLMDEMPIIPIYDYSMPNLVKPYVKGYYPNMRDDHPRREVEIVGGKGR